tara:strand:+ start:1596 stop:2240 length:645 start_codon:yes stop_codon:yes gene_type:complete
MRLILSFLFVLLSIPVAQAETYRWIYPDFGIEMSFPDNWMRQHTSGTKNRLHIMEETGADYAQCKVSAERDGRFEIYPADYFDDIVKRELDGQFWTDYLVNRKNPKINYLAEEGGLGRGYATYIDFTYQEDIKERPLPMRGLAYATIYHDMRVVVECVSVANRFEKWQPIFAGVVKTVDFDPKFHPHIYGDYRNVFRDYPVYIPQNGDMGVGGY